MKFFTDFEVLRAVYLSLLFGVFLSVAYMSATFFLDAFKKILALPLNLLVLCKQFSIKTLLWLSVFEKSRKRHYSNLFDAIICTVFGILFILHFYLVTDGVFRLFVLIFTGMSFILSYKTFAYAIAAILARAFSYLYAILLFLSLIMTMPMYKTLVFTAKIIQKLTLPIRKKHQAQKSNRITRKKITEVEKLAITRDLFKI